MKVLTKYLLSGVLGVMFIAGSAFAEKKELLVSLTQGGGFFPGLFDETKIYSNGEVTFRTNGDLEETVVAKLKLNVIKNILSISQDVKAVELEDIYPDLPECADGPTYSYQLIRKGVEIRTKQRVNCKDYMNPTAYSLDSVHSLLDGFSTLAR